MNKRINSNLLPQIIAAISEKPNLCDSLDNVYHEAETFVTSEYPKAVPSDIRKSIKKALEVGQELGVLTVSDELIKIPPRQSIIKPDYEPTEANGSTDDSINNSTDENMDEAASHYMENYKITNRHRYKKRLPPKEADYQYLNMPRRKNRTEVSCLAASYRTRSRKCSTEGRRERSRSARRTSRR